MWRIAVSRGRGISPTYTETGTFQEWNPGGYEEMGLFTAADLQRFEKERTREPYDVHGLEHWVSCLKDQRVLSDGLIAQTLTCTSYRSDYPSGDITQPKETIYVLPTTDCFVPVGKSLYLGFRVPMAAMDAAIDGCERLKRWGIRSVQVK
jgi:hypothetical protein